MTRFFWFGLAASLRRSMVLFCACVSAALAAGQVQGQTLPEALSEDDVPIALLVDAGTGQVLFARNPDRRFVPASITKAMTLYTAFELIEAGQLSLQQSLVVSPQAWMEWRGKGSRMFLNAEERVSVSKLLTGIATVSANDAAVVLAEGAAGSIPAWTAQMNAKARALGMTQSHFGTPNGWPDEGRTFTTARDLVTLGTALADEHSRAFARFIGLPEFRYGGITQPNRDPMLGRIEGADGIKTGFTNEAGFGFLGTAKRGDQRLVLVVGGVARGSTRGRAARNLVEWGFEAFDRRALFAEGAVVDTARVQNGERRTLDLVGQGAITLNVPKGREEAIRLTVLYSGPLHAPINAGDRVATLEIQTPGMETVRVPLLARESVAKAGILARITNAIARWFS